MQQSYIKADVGSGQAVRIKNIIYIEKQGIMNSQVVCSSSVKGVTDMGSDILCPGSHTTLNLAMSQNKFKIWGKLYSKRLGFLLW